MKQNFYELEYLNRTQAAHFLKEKGCPVSQSTLAAWACRKSYDLPFVKIGRLVRYRKIDLENWLISRTQNASNQ